MNEFVMTIGDLNINFDRLELEVESGNVWLWIGYKIVTSFNLRDYKIQFDFVGTYSSCKFYSLIKKEAII